MESSRVIGIGAVVIPTLIAASASIGADLIYFRGGGEVRLSAEADGDRIRVVGPDGLPLLFASEDLRAIVPGHWPDDEWPDRRDRAEAGDALDRYRASWWALNRGMVGEAVAMLRSAHEADPDLEPVAGLVEVLDRLDRDVPAPDLASLRKVVGPEFSEATNGRIRLLHQHDEADAADRLSLLDEVLTAFYLHFSALGFDLRAPSEQLVAVWFSEEADYRAFIRKEAGEAFLNTWGYYHPTRRAIFFVDNRGRPADRRSMDNARQRLDELDRSEEALGRLSPGIRLRLELSGERPRALDRESALRVIDELRRETNRAVLVETIDRMHFDRRAAVHELIHQLVIASGLAPRYESVPVWLHEGLAMQFEAFRGGRWAGLGEVPEHRLDQWRRLRRAPDLGPIVRDEGFGRGFAPERYAAAWSLVYHLRTRDPEGFVAFLDQLRNPDRGGDDRVVDAFRASFGDDLRALRSSWAEHLDSVRSPVETHRPPRRGR